MVPTWSQMVPHAPQMVPKWSKWFPNALQIVQNYENMVSRSVLGAFQGSSLILESILGGFGAPFWLPKGPQKSIKSFFQHFDCKPKFKEFFLTFRFHFGQISKLFLRPFWYWRSMQTEKADVQNHPIFTMDFQHFYQATSSENQAKSIQSDVKYWYRFGYDFRCDFGSIFGLFLIKKSTKIASKRYMKNNLGFSFIFLQFSMPTGACRPGFARETERASATSCDPHGLSNDSGANNGLLIILMILRADCHEFPIILTCCSVINAILIRSGPKMLPDCLQCSQHGANMVLNGPKCSPNGPQMVQVVPKCTPNRPQMV